MDVLLKKPIRIEHCRRKLTGEWVYVVYIQAIPPRVSFRFLYIDNAPVTSKPNERSHCDYGISLLNFPSIIDPPFLEGSCLEQTADPHCQIGDFPSQNKENECTIEAKPKK